MYARARGSPIKAPAVGFYNSILLTGIIQTVSGLPKKSLKERKVSSKGGRSKASGGKKEGLKAAVERLDSEQKVARKGFQAHFQARLFSSANPTRDSQDSREKVTFFNHVF